VNSRKRGGEMRAVAARDVGLSIGIFENEVAYFSMQMPIGSSEI